MEVPKKLFIYFVIFFVIDISTPLKCYTCTDERSNINCVDDYNLKLCDKGLDTCQTITVYSDVKEQLSIYKSCTKNVSCHNQRLQYRPEMCDYGRADWKCTYCCHRDKCNLQVASSTIQHMPYGPHTTIWIILKLIQSFIQ